MYYLKMAWRNIWRNKRRSLITMASILFAVFFALFMRAFQLGSYQNMVDNVVQAYTGYIQIFDHAYQKEKVLENSIQSDGELIETIESYEGVSTVVPRLESFALGSSGNQTKGVLVVGTEPDREDQLTGLSKRVIDGKYLGPGEHGVMVSERLAKYLKTGVGDTLVLISQGYHGASAANQYPVRAILRFSSPDLDNKMVYLDLKKAQDFFSAESLVSSISVNIEAQKKLNTIVNGLQKELGPDYEVKSWEKILVQLVQQIESDNAGGLIMLALLYMIIGFGIFGTVQMMVTERRREFGVMIAVGMQKPRLGRILISEMILLGLLGIVAGILLSIPVIWFGHTHPLTLSGEIAHTMMTYGMEPIMPTAWESSYFINQTLIAMLIILVAVVIPLTGIQRLKVTKALKG